MDLQASHTAAHLCALSESPWREGAVVLQSSKGATVAPSYVPSKAGSVKGQAKTRACAVLSPLPQGLTEPVHGCAGAI